MFRSRAGAYHEGGRLLGFWAFRARTKQLAQVTELVCRTLSLLQEILLA
jgi:hypothetical protein